MATRALVLGGGGHVGIGWESGLVAGLAQAGVLLGEADLIVGTSAGSVVGSQLALGRAPQQLFAAQLAQGDGTRRQNATGAAQPAPDLSGLMQLMAKAAAAGGSSEAVLREMGAYALQAQTISEDDFIAGFGRTLGTAPWPERRFVCTAVDTADGAFTTWDNDVGVPLARAVASSCAVPGIFPPITINGRRYMDGGVRSPTNADLARGYDIVIVVAVTAGAGEQTAMAEASRRRLEGELAGLREGGGWVELIVPNAGSLAAFGLNLMDAGRRTGAAEAGLRQGAAEAERLRSVWGAVATA